MKLYYEEKPPVPLSAFSPWLIIALVSLICGMWWVSNKNNSHQEDKATPYEHTFNKLTEIQTSLKYLDEYVENQREQLNKTRNTISILSNQKQTLESILSVDKPKVEAILAVANVQTKWQRYTEWLLSFLIGIVSSLTAAYFFEWRKSKKQTKKSGLDITKFRGGRV